MALNELVACEGGHVGDGVVIVHAGCESFDVSMYDLGWIDLPPGIYRVESIDRDVITTVYEGASST